jgi:hypothetical protein
MGPFGTVYQDGELIADQVQMARREERGTVHPRWRVQAILPRSIAERIARELFRRPVYQIEFEGTTEDYFVVGDAIPISANPWLLRQDFLSVGRSSPDGRG